MSSHRIFDEDIFDEGIVEVAKLILDAHI